MIAAWRRAVGAAILAGPLACRAAPTVDTSWHDEPGYRWRELERSTETTTPGFTSLDSTSTGIAFRNTLSLEKSLANRILAQGGGAAVGDVNGDDRPDIFLARTDGPSALYLNQGGLRFGEGAVAAGVAFGDRAVTGVALVDLDGDGDLDLLVNALGGPNALFLNDGRGRFTEDTAFADRGSRLGSTTSTIADIDGDGDLDLYTANYKAYTTLDRLSPQERAFDQIVRRHGPRDFSVHPRYRQDYRVYLRDDLRGVSLVQRADPDRLLLNDGSGRFAAAPMSGTLRFQDEDGRPLAEPREDFGLTARFYDIDGDGDPDLFVANDFEDPDQFWINDGQGQFRLIARTALRTTSNSGMAIDFADIDRDGAVDFFEVDMLSRDSRRLKTQIPTQTVLPKMPGVIDDRPQLQRNTLFWNRGDGTFAQIAEYAGVDASGWTWGTMFLDVDLDGFEDILVANGHRWDVLDADVLERLRNRLSATAWQRELTLFPPLELPNYAFRNRGDLTFEDMTPAWRFGVEADISHGMAGGDLDGDGDLDVVINRLDRPALVLRNDAAANRVAVRLEGAGANRHGIGATVRVLGGAVPLQSREVTAGGLYLSHSDYQLAFAAGRSDSLLIEVRWRSGQRSVVARARPNRLYQIAEPAGPPVAPAAPAPDSALFADATDSLGHLHHETWYDDAARQLLLPNLFSQLGPGATWYDLDGDGDDDLLIGTGQGGRPAWYRNDRGRFVAVPFGGTPPGDLTTLLVVPGSSGPTIVAGVSSYEAVSPAAALALSSVVAFPVGPNARDGVAIVPGDSASVGPLAAADYDGDGDLDLFIGGRIIPGMYPLSPRSRLFRNEGARGFQPDPTNSAAVGNPGMVSSALFTDLDDDGDPDLVLAIEWGPIKVFQNDAGRFSPAPDGLGFGTRFSRWLGLATGDFNEDGRVDLVTTSWGRNLRQQADSVHPLVLYAGHFNQDDVLDLLPARYDARLDAMAPLASFARLSRAVPEIAQRVRTFAAYADANIAAVLGPAEPTAFRLGATGFDHVVWFNRGGRFEPVTLPAEAQLAPAFGPVVADFDGDGHDDLILSQNFFPTDLNSPRYDAGRGLLLLGDGRGGFRPVSGQRSGLAGYGDQRGAAAADYDGDGRMDVVITQNGGPTRLYRNARGAPGIRVRLQGPAGNPFGFGATMRLRVGSTPTGPRREIHAGSGYWSQNSPVVVFGRPGEGPLTLDVRWPGGRRSEVAIAPGQPEVVVTPPR